jgi:DNA-binding IclR family transcriptional regulator
MPTMAEEPKTGGGARRPRRDPQINTSAGHVFDALRAIAASPSPISGADVAREVGVPVSTAHRALVTLEEAGYIVRYGGGPKLQLGLRSQELVAALIGRYAIRQVADPCLRALSRRTGETTTLTVRLGWYAVCVDGYEGTQAVHRSLRLGERSVLHRTASGRVLLAGQQVDFVRGYAGSAQAGPLSSVATRQLRRELAGIVERGYLVEEVRTAETGLSTVAFPVRDPSGAVIAAVAICGPSGQFSPGRDERLTAWQDLVAGIERQVEADPARFTDPFAHRSPASIVMSESVEPAG